MFDTMFAVIFLTVGNVALWYLILNRRARRRLVLSTYRGHWLPSKVLKEDVSAGELVVFCMAIVGEMVFALLTVAVMLELWRK